jgi:hypothetical protein
LCDRRWARTAPQAWPLSEPPGVAGPIRDLELSALRILTRGAVAGAADAALTASMGWVRPPFRPRSRHQRVLGGRRAQRHRVRDGRLTLGRCSDRGLMADMVPVGAIVSSLPSSQRLLLAVYGRSAACLWAAVYRAGGQLRDRAARGAAALGGRAGRGGGRGSGLRGRLRGNVTPVQSQGVDTSVRWHAWSV